MKNHENVDQQHKEGEVAKAIEQETAKIPSDVYLWSAISMMGVSLALKIMKKDETALFIGQWVSPLLLFGIYNKIVKTEGSDQTENNSNKAF